MAVANAAHAACGVAALVLPSLRIGRRRDSRNVLSKLATGFRASQIGDRQLVGGRRRGRMGRDVVPKALGGLDYTRTS
jgi:hypothetical protein